MFTRFTQSIMVLLMAVPMCWCCLAQALPAREIEKDCMSCHKFLLPEDMPKQHEPKSDCPCCQGTLERNLSPDIAAAPRLVLVDLQTWVWPPVEEMLPAICWAPEAAFRLIANHGPPRTVVPLYRQHCSMLT